MVVLKGVKTILVPVGHFIMAGNVIASESPQSVRNTIQGQFKILIGMEQKISHSNNKPVGKLLNP